MGGRPDLAGALVVGTIALSLVLVAVRGGLAASGLIGAVEVFAVSAMIGNAIPPLRDALHLPLRILGWVALVVAIVLAVPAVGGIDRDALAVAGALLVTGVVSSGATAALFRRDPLAVVAGAGLRDPVLAVALASTASASAMAVPLAYGAGCAILALARTAQMRGR